MEWSGSSLTQWGTVASNTGHYVNIVGSEDPKLNRGGVDLQTKQTKEPKRYGGFTWRSESVWRPSEPGRLLDVRRLDRLREK